MLLIVSVHYTTLNFYLTLRRELKKNYKFRLIIFTKY